jgi:hypothetical protein
MRIKSFSTPLVCAPDLADHALRLVAQQSVA